MKEKTQKQKEEEIIDVVLEIPLGSWVNAEITDMFIAKLYGEQIIINSPPRVLSCLKIKGAEIYSAEIDNLVIRIKSTLENKKLKEQKELIDTIYNKFVEK